MNQEIEEIELCNILANPYQPRKSFRKEEIEDLARSIKSIGLIQPPVVRRSADGSKYELISGERRFRAAELAGLEKIPVIIRENKDAYSAEASLVENIQRVDLNPLEIARALKRLADEFGYQQDELAERVGKNRSTVANYLRLLALPQKIRESLSAGEISMGHAKAILSIEGFERQLLLHEQALSEDLSVRETEQAAQQMDKIPRRRLSHFPNQDCYLQDLQEILQHKLGTKVTIQSKGKRGRIDIDYYSLDDLDRILEIINGHS
jgi:ParB family chromosome partitioning protein